MTPKDPFTTNPVKLNPFYKPLAMDLDRREFLAMLGSGVTFAAVSGSAADSTTPQPPSDNRPRGNGGGNGGGGGRGGGRGGDFVLPAAMAQFAELSVVLGRATDRSVTVSVLSKSAGEAFLKIGVAPGKYNRRTPVTGLPARSPVEVLVDRLEPNTVYHYRLQYRLPGASSFTTRPDCRFATQRAAGSSYTFTIQGDSHPERMGKVTNPELYARTLALAAVDGNSVIGRDSCRSRGHRGLRLLR